MAKANDEPGRASEAAGPPSPEPPAAPPAADREAIRHSYPPTVRDRFNTFFGRFVGGHGRRKGARDTDPGL